ncbi:Cyanate permease [Enhydrobacter aerosaccus]|uniref:Cyanate permease n=1 Tax=Enhydrobacter aerosaccus TaxID=225324 RepID=A0A1T4T665_9HYPH|nr:MFS transporter [Enhydrobacter aerosaccus]SKA35741.1 Cyanate permease [Enhydrobacter aerosaccus]
MSRSVPWFLVALCFALGVASRSISDSFPVFVPALQQAFTASRSAVTVVYSFALLVGGTAAPIAGWIVDRFGLRALTVTGMSAAAIATFSAFHATELWQLYLGLGVVMGFGSASLSGVLSSSVLGRWFPSHRLGVALAVAWSASGVGAIIILPLAERIIVTSGWREAYFVFSCISAAFIPVLLFLPWRRIAGGAPGLARHHGSAAGGMTVGEAVRDWPFWALTFSFGFTSLGIFALAPQAMVYLLERGIEGAYAARALAVAGFLTPLGMVGFSWLSDRGGRKLAAILAYASSIVGVGMLALVRGPQDDLWLWLYVLLFGGSMGSRGPMISTLATLRYRGPNFGRIYGLISMGMGTGGFLGAWIGGLLHDLTGGYGVVMIFSACSLALAATSLGAEAGARERLSR